MTSRQGDLTRFYAILDDLAAVIGGARLADCNGRMAWPKRGVYFFLERGEKRADSGAGARVVRVGTHALKAGARSTLWKRLYQHRGTCAGGGNHRGSVFRKLVGSALIKRESLRYPKWGIGQSAAPEIVAKEFPLEKRVTGVIGNMRVLWLAVTDAPGPHSRRGYIERNAIALLSNYDKPPMDAPSPGWLGRACAGEEVRRSGLWNQNHVDEEYDPKFLKEMKELAAQMGAS